MISDIKSKEVLEVNRLRTRKHRQSTGLVIVEGYPEVSRAVKAGVDVKVLYICPEIYHIENDEFQNTFQIHK